MSDIPYKQNPDGSLTLEVRVKPKSAKASIEPGPNNTLTVKLTAAPADGQANAQLIELIAKHLGLPKSKITIVRGQTARIKLLRITP